jgi:trehalose 6-phosphate phosphatase
VDPSDLLAPLVAAPDEAAILLDVDGTLAPIVARPEDAAVPEETRREVARLAGRYALVACISGRTGAEAARIVGVDRVVYVGVHGLELAPEARQWRTALTSVASSIDWPWTVEDKGLSIAFHYREADDEDAARRTLGLLADDAATEGLVAQWGRQVLELRPPVAADKGTAVQTLLGDRDLRRALYAGDDTTDIDAFRGLDGLEVGVRIAVASAEEPSGLAAAADVEVAGPSGLLEVLRSL